MANVASAANAVKTPLATADHVGQMQGLPTEMQHLDLKAFAEMTPQKYREMTGKRLGVKNSIALKLAQAKMKKQLKKDGDGITEGLYIVLAIFGLGWLAMGLLTDFDGSDWIISLLLYCLFWLPGVIYTLVKKKDYY